MFDFSPILIWGLVATVVVLTIIIGYTIFTGFDNTKEVEKLIDKANEFEKKRKCPNDNNVMIKEVVDGIVIDKCTKCGGVFLDNDELKAIRRKSDNTTEFGYIIAFFIAFFTK